MIPDVHWKSFNIFNWTFLIDEIPGTEKNKAKMARLFTTGIFLAYAKHTRKTIKSPLNTRLWMRYFSLRTL